MVDLNPANFITIGILAILAIAIFNWALAFMGFNSLSLGNG